MAKPCRMVDLWQQVRQEGVPVGTAVLKRGYSFHYEHILPPGKVLVDISYEGC